MNRGTQAQSSEPPTGTHLCLHTHVRARHVYAIFIRTFTWICSIGSYTVVVVVSCGRTLESDERRERETDTGEYRGETTLAFHTLHSQSSKHTASEWIHCAVGWRGIACTTITLGRWLPRVGTSHSCCVPGTDETVLASNLRPSTVGEALI